MLIVFPSPLVARFSRNCRISSWTWNINDRFRLGSVSLLINLILTSGIYLKLGTVNDLFVHLKKEARIHHLLLWGLWVIYLRVVILTLLANSLTHDSVFTPMFTLMSKCVSYSCCSPGSLHSPVYIHCYMTCIVLVCWQTHQNKTNEQEMPDWVLKLTGKKLK